MARGRGGIAPVIGSGTVGVVAGLIVGSLASQGADRAWLESIGTLAAAVVAAGAAVSALVIARSDRLNADRHAGLDRQHANLLSVLADTEVGDGIAQPQPACASYADSLP